MIEHIPELTGAGIASFKIEGRMKTALYVATVARTYRRAIDDYFTDPKLYENNLEWYRSEIGKCTYRQFTTGFYFGRPDEDAQIYDNSTYVVDSVFLGIIEEVLPDGRIKITQKNKFCTGDTIEIMKADGRNIVTAVKKIESLDGVSQESDRMRVSLCISRLMRPVPKRVTLCGWTPHPEKRRDNEPVIGYSPVLERRSSHTVLL